MSWRLQSSPYVSWTKPSKASFSAFDKRYITLNLGWASSFICKSKLTDLYGGRLSGSLSGNTSEKHVSTGCMHDGAALIFKEEILIRYTSAKAPSSMFLTNSLDFPRNSISWWNFWLIQNSALPWKDQKQWSQFFVIQSMMDWSSWCHGFPRITLCFPPFSFILGTPGLGRSALP